MTCRHSDGTTVARARVVIRHGETAHELIPVRTGQALPL